MKQEVNPQETSRAEAFELWMSSPMPMVTLTKTFNVSNLLKSSKKSGMKFNALLCWCIGKAASQMEVFYTLPEQGKLDEAHENMCPKKHKQTSKKTGNLPSQKLKRPNNILIFIFFKDSSLTFVFFNDYFLYYSFFNDIFIPIINFYK